MDVYDSVLNKLKKLFRDWEHKKKIRYNRFAFFKETVKVVNGGRFMPIYRKLIRDRIPEVIAASGKKAVIRVLEDEEYRKEARKKLHEELAEYESAEDDKSALEELADILELVYALAEIHGSSREDLEKIRAAKESERGGFRRKLFLEEVVD
jgi:predicted house-cleaning noncanonical NTP pyrophosphatase (MazG superfamily)